MAQIKGQISLIKSSTNLVISVIKVPLKARCGKRSTTKRHKRLLAARCNFQVLQGRLDSVHSAFLWTGVFTADPDYPFSYPCVLSKYFEGKKSQENGSLFYDSEKATSKLRGTRGQE